MSFLNDHINSLFLTVSIGGIGILLIGIIKLAMKKRVKEKIKISSDRIYTEKLICKQPSSLFRVFTKENSGKKAESLFKLVNK